MVEYSSTLPLGQTRKAPLGSPVSMSREPSLWGGSLYMQNKLLIPYRGAKSLPHGNTTSNVHDKH